MKAPILALFAGIAALASGCKVVEEVLDTGTPDDLNFDLSLDTTVTPMTANMPRAHKATLGKRLAEESMDLVVLIYRANSARDKTPHLQQLLERMQVVEPLLRLSRDLRLISTGQYARAIELTDAIGKQATGWRKHSAPPAA